MIVELHHETHGMRGSRTPLVLVHGGAGTIGSHWGAAIPHLSTDRLVVGVELQGHGHTPHASREYSFENSADDIAAVVRSLGLSPVDIMGFSNGGPTVLRFVQRHADLVNRTVVASGFYRRDGFIDGFWDGFDDPTIDSMPGALVDAYRAINPDPADLRRMFDLDVAVMRGFRDWDDVELAGLRGPVLYVSGDQDVVLPQHTIRMAHATPGGRALIVPAGHGDYLGSTDSGPVDRALTESCLTLIRRFLDYEPG
ncbi:MULTISPECIES: alpha/beta fold hydrolase [Gordonia]|jgi:pimeloyl-ACP methyl ester carboxylesterase|uniref:Alpha/beta fold hydrolase n=1 Tax=Gordonia aquimaris TaxID=2984863 RepID=A0A9X3D5P7_9ACTN|nr:MULTISPECIES: alpha/beta fold hydrolase [Gordonia]MAU80410.1 hydrolase [Gordonia sp. (in: high G+C Gram-positive bacteria)]MCX2964231.1 alpha/beta fold hydrolase [Gordonia aquimaris]